MGWNKLIAVVFASVLYLQGEAQTWDEWFRQRKTQRQYSYKQIVALQLYLGYIEKGYAIAKEGLGMIQEIKQGDFDLHNGHFNSLVQVNPVVKKYWKVAEVVSIQTRIVKRAKAILHQTRQAGCFTENEAGYCKTVIDRLLQDCVECLNNVWLVLKPGELEMKDDERMGRIDQFYRDMMKNYSFCEGFGNHVKSLAIGRLAEKQEVDRSKQLFGIK